MIIAAWSQRVKTKRDSKTRKSCKTDQQNGTESFYKVSFQLSGMATVRLVEGSLPQFLYNGEEQPLTFALNAQILSFRKLQ